jgi:hypothetical protein
MHMRQLKGGHKTARQHMVVSKNFNAPMITIIATEYSNMATARLVICRPHRSSGIARDKAYLA